jgi:HAAS
MTIDSYLAELERELRARRAPRARLLREVEGHLHDAADELAGSGLPRPAAEARAIARFGAATAVAARFAEAAASSSARRAVNVAAGALLAYCATLCAFTASASPLVRDFPQGAPSFFGTQLAAVAIAVAVARSFGRRRLELIYVTRAVLLAAGALTISALAEAAFALARPAGIVVWSEARWLTIGFAVATTTVLLAAIAGARAAAQAAAVDTPAAEPALRHPWRLTLGVAALAFALVTTAQLATGGAATLPGASAVGLLEGTAIVGGFALFGRFLGLRDRSNEAVAG